MTNENSEKTYQELKEKAEAALSADNSELAISIYEDAVTCFPGNPNPLVDLGNVFLDLRQLPEAERAFKKSLDISPGFSRGYHSLALICSAKEMYQQAIEYYQMAIDTGEAKYGTFNNLGNIYIDLKELNKAEKVFKQGCECGEHKSTALYNLGRVYALQKKYEQALEYYEPATKLLEEEVKIDHEKGLDKRAEINNKNLFMYYKSIAKSYTDLNILLNINTVLKSPLSECFQL